MVWVHKYGGTSLADAECLRRAAEYTAQCRKQGENLVLVVSAQGDTTDRLLEKAKQLHPNPSGRELDACLSAGEQISASLLALALENLGIPGVSLTGAQAGIYTDGCYGSGRICRIDPKPISCLLEQGIVPVVTGFQGAAPDGSVTTLGRGGSDTTAVALAASLGGACRIFTDVDGVYDRDPRRFPDAKKFTDISAEEMLIMAKGGARVLHTPCVELAMEKKVPVWVESSLHNREGTRILS